MGQFYKRAGEWRHDDCDVADRLTAENKSVLSWEAITFIEIIHLTDLGLDFCCQLFSIYFLFKWETRRRDNRQTKRKREAQREEKTPSDTD